MEYKSAPDLFYVIYWMSERRKKICSFATVGSCGTMEWLTVYIYWLSGGVVSHPCWYSVYGMCFVCDFVDTLTVLSCYFGLLQSAFQILIVHSSGLKRTSFLKGKSYTE